MKLVYISGPYRAKTINGIVENISQARKVALKYWQKGYAVICPHLNTALFDGGVSEKDADIWLKGDLEILKRCDIVVMMRGWELSEGACAEHQIAKEQGLEIIYD